MPMNWSRNGPLLLCRNETLLRILRRHRVQMIPTDLRDELQKQRPPESPWADHSDENQPKQPKQKINRWWIMATHWIQVREWFLRWESCGASYCTSIRALPRMLLLLSWFCVGWGMPATLYYIFHKFFCWLGFYDGVDQVAELEWPRQSAVRSFIKLYLNCPVVEGAILYQFSLAPNGEEVEVFDPWKRFKTLLFFVQLLKVSLQSVSRMTLLQPYLRGSMTLFLFLLLLLLLHLLLLHHLLLHLHLLLILLWRQSEESLPVGFRRHSPSKLPRKKMEREPKKKHKLRMNQKNKYGHRPEVNLRETEFTLAVIALTSFYYIYIYIYPFIYMCVLFLFLYFFCSFFFAFF